MLIEFVYYIIQLGNIFVAIPSANVEMVQVHLHPYLHAYTKSMFLDIQSLFYR